MKPRPTPAQEKVGVPPLSKEAERVAAEKTDRITFELPARVKRAIKMRALERGQTLQGYLLGLIKADGIT